MKRQYLTYYSLRWSGGKYEFYWRRHWSSHTLGFPSVCSDSCAKPLNISLSPPAAVVLLSKPALDRASHLFTGAFDVDSVLQCISFVFEGSASTIQQGLKFHILQVLQCDNLGAGYALYIFHKRIPSPESEMWKSQCLKVYIDRNCFWDFWVWDENTLVIMNISESALHLPLEGGKYPNKQRKITFDWGQPCHYKTNLVDWTLLRGHRGHDGSFSSTGQQEKYLLLISQGSWYVPWASSFNIFLNKKWKSPCQGLCLNWGTPNYISVWL